MRTAATSVSFFYNRSAQSYSMCTTHLHNVHVTLHHNDCKLNLLYIWELLTIFTISKLFVKCLLAILKFKISWQHILEFIFFDYISMLIVLPHLPVLLGDSLPRTPRSSVHASTITGDGRVSTASKSLNTSTHVLLLKQINKLLILLINLNNH